MEGFDAFNGEKEYELIYAIEPSSDPMAQKGGRIGKERPYIATYFCPELKEIINEEGLSYFPFLVPRWALIAGEVWGRGPAATCLSNIQMINKMKKELIKSAEIANAPPLSAEEDSILMPMKYGSRQMIWRTMGSEVPQPVLSGTQPQLSLEMMQAEQDAISRSFFVDQIIREQKKERQSITEIQDERGQMLQQLGPLLARQEAEFLGPAIETTFDLLDRQNLIPEEPESLQGAELEIVYTSPAAYAQYASKISDLSAFMQDITPLANVSPELLENLNGQELFDTYSRYRNVPRRVVRSKEDVEAAKEQRAQAEQMQQASETVPQVAGAMKDVASAKATDPEGMGQLLNSIGG